MRYVCFGAILLWSLLIPVVVWGEGKKASDFTVAIDAGHGYNTAGKRSAPFTREVTHRFKGRTVTVRQGEQFREHVANAAIAANLEKILRKMGFRTVKVAWNDADGTDDTEDVSLSARQAKIRESGAQISVSCHYNAIGDGASFNGTGGVLTYIHSEPAKCRDSAALGRCIQNQIVAIYGQQDRGTPPQALALCNCEATGCKASVLVEHAFMTCEQEAVDYFCNPEAWHNYAIGIAKGICDYTEVKYKGPKPTVQKTKAQKGPKMGNTDIQPKSGTLVVTYTDGLNVRTGPGTGYPVSEVVHGGSYTVVGVSKDGKWYRLKSGGFITSGEKYVQFTAE